MSCPWHECPRLWIESDRAQLWSLLRQCTVVTVVVELPSPEIWNKKQKTRLVQDGAPKIAKLPYFSGFMVDITLYNYSFHRAYFMVYKPTNITGGPHPVWFPLPSPFFCHHLCGDLAMSGRSQQTPKKKQKKKTDPEGIHSVPFFDLLGPLPYGFVWKCWVIPNDS